MILAKKMQLTFKMTCTFVLLQILLAGGLIRSYLTQFILSCFKLLLSCWITIAKFLNQICFYH